MGQANGGDHMLRWPAKAAGDEGGGRCRDIVVLYAELADRPHHLRIRTFATGWETLKGPTLRGRPVQLGGSWAQRANHRAGSLRRLARFDLGVCAVRTGEL